MVTHLTRWRGILCCHHLHKHTQRRVALPICRPAAPLLQTKGGGRAGQRRAAVVVSAPAPAPSSVPHDNRRLPEPSARGTRRLDAPLSPFFPNAPCILPPPPLQAPRIAAEPPDRRCALLAARLGARELWSARHARLGRHRTREDRAPCLWVMDEPEGRKGADDMPATRRRMGRCQMWGRQSPPRRPSCVAPHKQSPQRRCRFLHPDPLRPAGLMSASEAAKVRFQGGWAVPPSPTL